MVVMVLTLEEEDQTEMEMIFTLAELGMMVSQTEEDLVEMTEDVREGEVEILQDLRDKS